MSVTFPNFLKKTPVTPAIFTKDTKVNLPVGKVIPADVAYLFDCKSDKAKKGPDPEWSYVLTQYDSDGQPISYTNLLPAGAENFAGSAWTRRGTTPTLNADGSYRITLGAKSSKDISGPNTTGLIVSQNIQIKLVSGSTRLVFANAAYDASRLFVSLSSEFQEIKQTFTHTANLLGPHLYSEDGTDLTVDIKCPQVTATTRPMPYIAPGTTTPSLPAVHGKRGVWVGPAYTQLCKNSEFLGAQIGTTNPANWAGLGSGSITRQIVGVGTGYVDVRFSGTATAIAYVGIAPATVDKPAAVAGEYVSVCAKVTLLSGDWSACYPRLEVQGQTSAYGYVESSATQLIGRSGLTTSHTRTMVGATVAFASYGINFTIPNGQTVDFTIRISQPTITKTSVPMPYVATGPNQTISVASAASTTDGNGLAVEMIESFSIQRILPATCTVAALWTPGFASSAVTADTNILTVDDTVIGLMYASTGNTLKTNDGTHTASVSCTWAANEPLIVAVEYSGTTQRIGFARLTDTAITWGPSSAFDESENPTSYLRFSLTGTLPQWIAKTMAAGIVGMDLSQIKERLDA